MSDAKKNLSEKEFYAIYGLHKKLFICWLWNEFLSQVKSVKKSSVSYSEITRELLYGCGHHCDSALCLLACHSIAVTAAEALAYRADACAYVFFSHSLITAPQFLRLVGALIRLNFSTGKDRAFVSAHLWRRPYTVNSQKWLTHTVTHTRKRADGSSGNMGAEEYFISSRND